MDCGDVERAERRLDSSRPACLVEAPIGTRARDLVVDGLDSGRSCRFRGFGRRERRARWLWKGRRGRGMVCRSNCGVSGTCQVHQTPRKRPRRCRAANLLRSSTDSVLSTPKLVDARVRGVAAVGNHRLPEQATVTQRASDPRSSHKRSESRRSTTRSQTGNGQPRRCDTSQPPGEACSKSAFRISQCTPLTPSTTWETSRSAAALRYA
jgi:hypothetical protein